MKHRIDTGFYPGWTRKAVSFTIDDGNVKTDRIWLSYMRPAGIRGTFNLCSHNLNQLGSAEEYRAFYRGYGIANHVKYHPYCVPDGEEPRIADGEPTDDAEIGVLFPESGIPGLYRFRRAGDGAWRKTADAENYLRFARESREELSRFFGFPVTEFVWPFDRQNNAAVNENLAREYESVRRSGATKDSTGFAVPRERIDWHYNANQKCLSDVSRLYEEYPDTGELTCLIVGVHSVDYERENRWGEVADFCRRFGNQPEKYWSAPIRDLFRYADAAKSVVVTEDRVINPSEIDLYVKVDGERRTLCAGCEMALE